MREVVSCLGFSGQYQVCILYWQTIKVKVKYNTPIVLTDILDHLNEIRNE